jgi:hypothetical protein
MAGQLAAQILVVKDGPGWVPYAIAIGTCATAVIALFTAILGLRSIKQNHDDAARKHDQERNHALQARALHYMERYNGRRHVGPRARLNAYFMIRPAQQEKRIETWEKMPYRETLLTVQGLNFWEELSGMYNRDLVDREIVDDYFGPEAEHIWKRISWFVTYQRNKDPDAMIEMQEMCKTIRGRRQAEGKPVEPVPELPTVGLGRPQSNTTAIH